MLHLLARRLLVMVPLLVLITILVFGLVVLIPGDPAVTLAGENPSPERIAEIRELMGLNEPLWQQYGHWMSGVVRGDLGQSFFSSETVWGAILGRLPATLSLTLVTLVLALVFGVSAGIAAGMRPGRLLDRVVTFVASAGVAVPHFWLGMILVILLALRTDVFPAVGYVPLTQDPVSWLRHLILPATALGAAAAAEMARQARASMTQVMQQDYVRTARAKGLSSVQIVGKHVLKNAAIPVVTVVGLQGARLVGGTVVIEQIFALPGIGNLAYQSVFNRDFPVIQGVVLIGAVLVLTLNLLVDLSYGYFNPRIRRATS